MHLRIYFGQKSVYLCDRIPSFLEAELHRPDAFFMEEASPQAVKSLLHEIARPEVRTAILLHPDLEKLRRLFWKQFQVQPAAGGLVVNGRGEWLLIHRRGHWDLPKGKLDEGETLEECAVREVTEETGLTDPMLGELICTTYHTFKDYGHHILKESHWYHMSVEGVPELTPQTEEDITDIAWLAREGVQKIVSEAYPSIQDVLKEASVI
jgi:8-oxo-dGTP pyrophosphatase MutT (NUDIX family)